MSATIERGAHGAAAPTRRRRLSIAKVISVYGLLMLLMALVVAFSALLPDTFPTTFTIQSILSDKAAVVLLALAVMTPMAAGQFDLSVGYVLGVTHILAVGLQVRSGVPWVLASLIVLCVGAVVGLINGLLVEWGRIDSFIATLGMGTVVYGLANWYTNGEQVTGPLPSAFLAIAGTNVLGVPLPAIIALVVAAVLWVVFEYTPVGRYLYALGANSRAAELTGISRRYVVLAFVISGLLCAIAGIVTASRLRVGQTNIGPDFLLPAFVGALLGATSIRPGRVNVVGTVLAVLVLAVGIAGLQQAGAAFFVEPLFNGATLVVAVGLAGLVARRRLAGARAREARGTATRDTG